MRFGAWLPLERAAELAPAEPGLLQARSDALLAFPRGKSAMVLYAASGDTEDLRTFVRGPGQPALARAAALGARWVRFAASADGQAALRRLLAGFAERFGGPPPGNDDRPTPIA